MKVAKVPIMPAAVLFDLGVGSPAARPDAAMGYAACEAASEEPLLQGAAGAGTGATVGKMLGPMFAMQGGVGTASMKTSGGAVVAAAVAVNAAKTASSMIMYSFFICPLLQKTLKLILLCRS